MGVVAGCDCCLGTKTDVIPNGQTDSSCSSDESEASTSDEQHKLLERQRKRKRAKRYREKQRYKKRQNSESNDRDESYFSSDDSNYKKEKREKRKRRRDKKRKKEGDIDRSISDIQKELREKSKNEIHKNNISSSENVMGLYGMDKKTMELLLGVGDLVNPSIPPAPPMPSIPSVPLQSFDTNDAVDIDISPINDKEEPPMKIELKTYTSDMLYSDDHLNVVDDGDATPALPQDDNNLLTVGGLDYDFGAPQTDDEIEPQTILDALQSEEKNLSYSRIARLEITAQKSQNPEHMQQLIAAHYSHRDEHEEEEKTDESSYSNAELTEILKRKTAETEGSGYQSSPKLFGTGIVLQAKLYRPETRTPWNDEDLSATTEAMSKELEALKSHIGDGNLSNTYEMIVKNTELESAEQYIDDYKVDQLIAIKPFDAKQMPNGEKKSQLFRMVSTEKWDEDRLESEKDDMQAHLMSLLSHQASHDSEPVAQSM